MADPATQTLFEATATSDPFVAKADILERHTSGWHIIEVKSSFADTSQLKDLIDDLAYTVFVFQRAGVSIARASLLLLSRSFRFGDGPDRLFQVVDTTDRAFARAGEFGLAADAGAARMFSPGPPPAKLSSAAAIAVSSPPNVSERGSLIPFWRFRNCTSRSWGAFQMPASSISPLCRAIWALMRHSSAP